MPRDSRIHKVTSKRDGRDRWRVRWHDRDQDGKHHHHQETFPTWQEAHDHLGEIETGKRTGTGVSPSAGKITLTDFFAEFMAGSQLSPSTRDLYERHFRLYIAPTLGHRPLRSLSPTDIRTWRTKLSETKKPATVSAVTRLLKTILNRAVNDRKLGLSPARPVKNPAIVPDGGMRVLEPEQVRALVDAHPERFRALALLLAYRGPRIGEAAALRVGDLNLMRGTMTIDESRSDRFGVGRTKTRMIRTVSLPAFLRDSLVAHIARFGDPKDASSFVFTAPEGGPLSVGNYRRRIFAKAVMDAGLDEELTPHDLRDTAATLAFKAGGTVREVQLMLGHADPAITLRRYTGVLDSMKAATDAGLEAMYRTAETAAPESATVATIGGGA